METTVDASKLEVGPTVGAGNSQQGFYRRNRRRAGPILAQLFSSTYFEHPTPAARRFLSITFPSHWLGVSQEVS